jgi:hypothetical protein
MSETEFDYLWEIQGYKYRMWELWQELGSKGLRTPMNIFVKLMRQILHEFLVEGQTRKDPKEINRKTPHWWRNV